MKRPETIVVVDDENAQRVALTAILEEQGYEVTSFGSTQAAMDFIKTNVPDLVLSDLGLPDQHGSAFVEQLKALKPDIECILMTGYASVGSVVDAMRLGVRDYLVKPFKRAELLNAVGRVLRTRSAKTPGSPPYISKTNSEDLADDLIARYVHKLNNALLPFVFELDQHLAHMDQFNENDQRKFKALHAEILALNTAIKNTRALIKPR